MKQVSHYDKVMWRLYCEYSYINSEVHYRRAYSWEGEYTKFIRETRRSKEEWDFIRSKYYYVTKVDPIYKGSALEFLKYLEHRTWGGKHRRSPYNYKKDGYHFKHSQKCGKNSYRWVYTSGKRSKDQKKPKHIKKKTVSEDEIRRREWRNKVKDPRNQGTRFYSSKYKKLSKIHGNRTERRHIKGKMHTGIWEEYPRSSLYWETRDCYCESCYLKPKTWEYNYPENEWDNFLSRKKREWLDPWDWD